MDDRVRADSGGQQEEWLEVATKCVTCQWCLLPQLDCRTLRSDGKVVCVHCLAARRLPTNSVALARTVGQVPFKIRTIAFNIQSLASARLLLATVPNSRFNLYYTAACHAALGYSVGLISIEEYLLLNKRALEVMGERDG